MNFTESTGKIEPYNEQAQGVMPYHSSNVKESYDVYSQMEKYDDVYSCLLDGYTKSIEKTEELGRIEVNAHKIFIKFDCYEDKTYKSAISGESFTEAIQSSYKR